MPLIRNWPSCGKSDRIPAKHLSDVGKCGACKALLPAIGEPVEVNEEQFHEIIRESKVPVLTDFWASWFHKTRRLLTNHLLLPKPVADMYPATSLRDDM